MLMEENHVRFRLLCIHAAVAAGLIGPANAQFPERDDRPNRLPSMACQNWNAQVRGGDPQLMAQLAGVWRSRGMIPGTPGLMQPTPEVITMTRYPDGQMVYEKSACFAPPPPPPGLPPLQGACAKSIGHGAWYAHADQGGWIFVGVLMQGSGYTGEMTPINCSGVRVRFIGENSIVNEAGVQGQRIAPAR
jgi:hypothetical protein